MRIRNKWVHIKVSIEERQQWQERARAEGVTVADLIRAQLDVKTVDRPPRVKRRTRVADPKLLAWLGRLNSNLNMIAHWCNRYKSRAEVVQVLPVLIGIERAIKEEVAGHLENKSDHHGSH